MPASDLKPEADAHGDGPRFKVYDVMGVPIIQDVTSGASAIAAQYGESLPSMVDDMNTMGRSVEVKQRLGSAVENLDILAYAGLDQLQQRLPRLTISAPKLMEKSKDSMYEHLSAPNLYTTTMTEFVASFAIVQLLLRSTDAVLGKVEATLPSLPVLGLRRSARALRRAGNRKNAKRSIASNGIRNPCSRSLMGGLLDILGVNYLLGFIGLEMVPMQTSTAKKRSTRRRRQGSDSEDEEEPQKFKDLDFARYNSESDADYSPSELSGEDDPLEYDSQTEEPEPRFAEVAEAEVVEGDEGEEVDSVEINSEDYDSEGERI